MKNNSKLIKIMNTLLVFSNLLTFSSCNANKDSNRGVKQDMIVSEDSPWFEDEIVDVDLGVDSKRAVEDLYPKYIGSSDQYIFVFANGWYKVDWNRVTTNADYAIKNIIILDRFSKQVYKTIDLFDILGVNAWPEMVSFFDGQLIVKCMWREKDAAYFSTKEFYIDPESETITVTRVYDRDNGLYFDDSYNIGDYRVEVICDQRSTNIFYTLRVFSADENMNEVDVKVAGKDIYGIPTIVVIDNTTLLIPLAMEREYKFFKLNLCNYELTEVNGKDYEWFDVDKMRYSSFSDTNGKLYYTTDNGISVIDMNNKTEEVFFNYNWCGVNSKYLRHLEITECSDNKIILCGRYNSSNLFESDFVSNFVIVEFTKADKNPHAGKQILELYTPDGQIDETISDAIIVYNDTNDNFFIKISDRYCRRDYVYYSDIHSLDDYESAQLTANVKLCDDLAMDIMNGEGPDLLLNTSNMGQLNNDNYLIDLSPYITGLDSDKYFTNIIDGAKYGGKLYQLPISFTIEGIQTDPDYAGNTGVGFTTDEYNRFLYDTLNGKDVIESGQSLYFVKLFNGMSDCFIANNKVNLTGSDFADIAGYVRENVKQDSLSWDTITEENVELVDFTTKGNKTAYYCNCPGISGYLVKRAQIKNGTAILGIPSSDGRGPMFGTDISVAISTHAVNIDACVEFVKILLSDDVQNELVMSDKFVLNRDAFKMGCNAAIEYFNTEEGSQNLFDYAAGTYVTSHMKFASEDIDNLESVIMSCSKMDSADSAINAILIEEMPAYFLGQKDLDSVVVIIQDRVQKVLDERG